VGTTYWEVPTGPLFAPFPWEAVPSLPLTTRWLGPSGKAQGWNHRGVDEARRSAAELGATTNVVAPKGGVLWLP